MTEKATLFLIRDGMTLRPRARFDASLLEKFKPQTPIQAELYERRNEGRMRLYWACLQAVCDATGRWPNAEALHWALKVRLGLIEEIASVNGEPLIRPRSVSFGKMSESDFREYFDSALSLITTEVVPGLSVEDLLALGNQRLLPGKVA